MPGTGKAAEPTCSHSFKASGPSRPPTRTQPATDPLRMSGASSSAIRAEIPYALLEAPIVRYEEPLVLALPSACAAPPRAAHPTAAEKRRRRSGLVIRGDGSLAEAELIGHTDSEGNLSFASVARSPPCKPRSPGPAFRSDPRTGLSCTRSVYQIPVPRLCAGEVFPPP